MADSNYSRSSTSNTCSSSSSGTSITSITEDDLFSILVLLPVESILALSMTCKKMRAMASSDALWESICRRDWGPTSLDAVQIDLHRHHQIPWMRLYKQVSQLDSVSCYKLSDPSSSFSASAMDDYPHPRASHSLNFVSDFLVLFGGGYEGDQGNVLSSSNTFLASVHGFHGLSLGSQAWLSSSSSIAEF